MSDEKILPSVRKAIQRSNEIMRAKYGRDFDDPVYKYRRKLVAEWFDAKRRGDAKAMEEIDIKLRVIRK